MTPEQLAEIKERTENQASRYGAHWNRLLADRKALLDYVTELQAALKFCGDLAAEEYSACKKDAGMELVLRHVMRKAAEALKGFRL
jgi:hypothetical protein